MSQMSVRRGLAAAGAILALAASVAIAVSWIDDGEDTTCSSVVHPSQWLGERGCQANMGLRTVVALVFGAAAVVLAVVAVRRGRAPSRVATVAAGLVVAASVLALLVNEAVRPQGLF